MSWAWWVAQGVALPRLVARSRYTWGPSWSLGRVMAAFTELASFLMETRMLAGIRRRAEQGV